MSAPRYVSDAPPKNLLYLQMTFAISIDEVDLVCLHQSVTHKINNDVIMKLTGTHRQQQISLEQTLDTGASVLQGWHCHTGMTTC